MAEGDVVADTVEILAAGTAEVQPGAGVEWLITAVGFDAGDGNSLVAFWDGTDNSVAFSGASTNVDWENIKIPITNTQRIRLENSSVGTRQLGYRGIILKD